MLCERSQRNDRDRRIDIVHGASEQIGRGRFISWRERTKPNKKGNVALESTRERQVNSANRLFFEERVARCRYDADYFDRLSLLLFFNYITYRITRHRCRYERLILLLDWVGLFQIDREPF